MENVQPQFYESRTRAYLDTLSGYNVNPLWTVMEAAVPPKPAPKAVPHLWNYDAIRPKLLEAAKLIAAEQAERRVLMLTNPKLTGVYTSDTLYAGLQIINHGETARAHRHTAFATRFIVEGENGFTAVNGDKIYMQRGDFIVTPSWTWHDHGHEGEGPMVWLDGLDLPLFQAIPVNFAEGYKDARYPSREVGSTPLRVPWKEVQARLDSQMGDYATYTYDINGPAGLSHTLGAEAERIDVGCSSPQRQDSASYVFHVYQGEGRTVLEAGGTIEWKSRDTFVIPAWVSFRHECTGAETCYLYSFTDKPILQALGLFRSR